MHRLPEVTSAPAEAPSSSLLLLLIALLPDLPLAILLSFLVTPTSSGLFMPSLVVRSPMETVSMDLDQSPETAMRISIAAGLTSSTLIAIAIYTQRYCRPSTNKKTQALSLVLLRLRNAISSLALAVQACCFVMLMLYANGVLATGRLAGANELRWDEERNNWELAKMRAFTQESWMCSVAYREPDAANLCRTWKVLRCLNFAAVISSAITHSVMVRDLGSYGAIKYLFRRLPKHESQQQSEKQPEKSVHVVVDAHDVDEEKQTLQ